MGYYEARERTKKGFKNMKKIVLLSLVASLFSTVAIADIYREDINTCDEYEMRAALDKATATNRAVITIVECDNGIVRTIEKPIARPVKPACTSSCCGCDKKEEVVKREYFVRETVQQYEPVVQYVPTTTYTRVKPACNHGCN